MGREPPAGRSPEAVDRILVGVCGAIWLVWLAVSVFALVALIRLGTGNAGGGEQRSSWLLYSVIAVSALIIAGAIPLLMRARRAAQTDSAAEKPTPDAPVVPVPDAPTEKMRVFGVDPYARPAAPEGASSAALAEVADRLWLRGTMSLLAGMGLALTAVSAATYLLAVASDTAAWVVLGLAGAITVALPAVLVFYQRQVGAVADHTNE